ncbi:MAG: beta-ketoacyl-ACP synthase II [Spirochaetales bacterium]|nr:beta-ketoacyl-ACP synthase II [Spirochaetales bacterium]
MNTKVAVTGMGVISPVGNSIDAFWNALVAGKSGIGPITRFDPSRVESKIAAEVKDFDPGLWMERKEARKMALFSQFAVAAAVQAWQDAGLPEFPPMSEEASLPEPVQGIDPCRIAVVMGNGIGGFEVYVDSHAKMLEQGPDRIPPMTIPLMISNEAAANIAMRLGLHGPAFTQVTACASGTDAIGQALDLLRSGRVDIVVAGGTEAAITEFSVGGFCRLKALSTSYNEAPERASRPFDRDRDGFVMGEGAAVLVLERLESAQARGARVHAMLAGYGATCDAYHLTAPHPDGIFGARAIELALQDSGLSPEAIGYYNAHGTGTALNDPMETRMLKTAFGPHAGRLKVSSTKSMTGHCIAAAGAIEAIACIKALETGILPPTIHLDNPDTEQGCDLDYVPNHAIECQVEAAMSASLGFGGHNGILVFTRS